MYPKSCSFGIYDQQPQRSGKGPHRVTLQSCITPGRTGSLTHRIPSLSIVVTTSSRLETGALREIISTTPWTWTWTWAGQQASSSRKVAERLCENLDPWTNYIGLSLGRQADIVFKPVAVSFLMLQY